MCELWIQDYWFGSFYRAGVASYSIQKVKKEDMTSTKPEKQKLWIIINIYF